MTSCNIDNLSLNNMDFHASVLSSVADYDWVFTWEDTQKIHSMSYDSDWCYKDPKMI